MEIDLGAFYRTLARSFRTVDRCDLADAIATSQAVVWEVRDQGTVVHNVEAYCTTIARRYLSREVRRRRKHTCLDLLDPEVWECMTVEDPDVLVDAHEVLEQAPEMYAEIMRMHYLEGRSFEDIARHLEISPEAARKRHERALKWARRTFQEPLDDA